MFEGFVGRQDDRAAFVTLADDLEEQVGTVLVDGKIADLIQDQPPWPEIFLELGFERALFLGGAQVVEVENELADFGYNRDGKKGKKQLVAGLLTDGNGEPISIELYRGNTGDPPTFLDAVQKLKVRFGVEEVALVGDRGMIKRLGKAALGEAKFCYVTALTDPQIRALLAKKASATGTLRGPAGGGRVKWQALRAAV